MALDEIIFLIDLINTNSNKLGKIRNDILLILQKDKINLLWLGEILCILNDSPYKIIKEILSYSSGYKYICKFVKKLYSSKNPKIKNYKITKISFPYSISTILNPKIIKKIIKKTNKILGSAIWMPLINQSFLDPKFILNLFFKDVYPLPIPKEIKFRDILHGLADNKRNILYQYIIRLFEAYYNKGGSINNKKVIKKFYKYACQKYKHISKFFLECIQDLSNKQLNKELIGLYLIFREFYIFNIDIFSHDNENALKDYINKLPIYIEKILYERDSWFNPDDPFITSPNSNDVILSDKKIKKKILSYLIEDDKNKPELVWDEGEGKFKTFTDSELIKYKKEKYKKYVDEIKIQNLEQFIDIQILYCDGYKQKMTFPKLNRKLNNFGSFDDLFKLCNIHLKLPILSDDLNMNRNKTIDFLKEINVNIIECIKSSQQYLLNFLNIKSSYLIKIQKINLKIKKCILI